MFTDRAPARCPVVLVLLRRFLSVENINYISVRKFLLFRRKLNESVHSGAGKEDFLSLNLKTGDSRLG